MTNPVLGVITNMSQRRASQRIPMELPVEIRWKSRAGSPKQAMGKIGNISGTGLFIEFPVRLRRETSVTIKLLLPREGTQGPWSSCARDESCDGTSAGRFRGWVR